MLSNLTFATGSLASALPLKDLDPEISRGGDGAGPLRCRYASLGQENGTRKSVIGSRGGAPPGVPEGCSASLVCVFPSRTLQARLAVHGIQNLCGGRMLAADEVGEVPAAPVRRPWKRGRDAGDPVRWH